MIGGELKPVPKSKKYGYVESTLDTGNSVNKVQKMQQEKNYGTSFQVWNAYSSSEKVRRVI